MSFEPIEYRDDFERRWEVYWEFSPITDELYKTFASRAQTAAKAQPEPHPFKVGDRVEGALIGFPFSKQRGKFLGFDEYGFGMIENPGKLPWYVAKDAIKLIEPAKRHAHNPDGEA